MHLEIYQIVIVLLALVMLGQGIKKYASQQTGQTLLKVFVRIVVWGGMIVVVLFPRITNMIAEIIGIQGNLNAVILVGFLLVFLMVFKLLSAIEKLEQQLTALTREESLKNFKEDTNK